MFSLRRPLPWPKAKPPVVYDEIGDEVSVEGLICQAAQAIDIAGKLAAEQRDSQRMMQTAECWTKLADFIVALSEHQDKKKLDKKSDFPVGFQASEVNDQEDEHEIIAEEDEDVRSDEG